jgi:hypothetical protein
MTYKTDSKQSDNTRYIGKRAIAGVFGGGMLLASGAASAALLSITGGSPISPSGNDVLGSVTLQDNAILSTTAPGVTLTYFFRGSESGFTNTLNTPFGAHDENNSIPGFPGSLLFSGVQAVAGPVSLAFTSSGFGGVLFSGGAVSGRSIAFAYLDSSGAISASPTDLAVFALDDGGAPDGDYDDYVGYVAAVPLSPAVWLLGSALVGLGLINRRREV